MGALSAVIGILNSAGKRIDEALGRGRGYPPVWIKLGAGLAATAAANGSEETHVTISATGVAALSDATPASLGGSATPGPGASSDASRADHVHAVALASASYAGAIVSLGLSAPITLGSGDVLVLWWNDGSTGGVAIPPGVAYVSLG